jgi:hypothetical protein
MPRSTALLAFAAAACGGAAATVTAPATFVVDVPAPQDDVLPATPSASSAAASSCPPDAVPEKGACVRVVASPEIPAWKPPVGHGDPCATWTSEKGLVDCDWKNELPADSGRR